MTLMIKGKEIGRERCQHYRESNAYSGLYVLYCTKRSWENWNNVMQFPNC